MVKTAKTVIKEKYKNLIRCPNCGRVLGNVVDLNGNVTIIYICPKCGDIEIDIKSGE